jgi:hypothetical protein
MNLDLPDVPEISRDDTTRTRMDLELAAGVFFLAFPFIAFWLPFHVSGLDHCLCFYHLVNESCSVMLRQ